MSHPSEYGRLRFCPKCGGDKIKRDWINGTPNDPKAKQPKVGCEYVCDTCGFGFWISKSKRVMLAEAEFAEARKRAPVKFTEKCVGTEVALQYLETQKGPPMLRTLSEKIANRLGFSNKCKSCNHTKHSGKCKDNYGKCECVGA